MDGAGEDFVSRVINYRARLCQVAGSARPRGELTRVLMCLSLSLPLGFSRADLSRVQLRGDGMNAVVLGSACLVQMDNFVSNYWCMLILYVYDLVDF